MTRWLSYGQKVMAERLHQDHWTFDEILTLEGLHWILCQESILCIVVVGKNGRRFGSRKVIARKGNAQEQDKPVHDQPKRHANKHAKGLKDWLFKDFFVSRLARGVQLHHGFGTNRTGRARNNGNEKNDQLYHAASFGRGRANAIAVGGGCCSVVIKGGRAIAAAAAAGSIIAVALHCCNEM